MIRLSSILPYFIKRCLFGDRKKFGLLPDKNDGNWAEWEKRYLDFYLETQKGTLGRIITHSGYKIMGDVELSGKRVLEVGPGVIAHSVYWRGKPKEYVLVDVQESMLSMSGKILDKMAVSNRAFLVKGSNLPPEIEKNSFDVIVSFNSLEHLTPLPLYLETYSEYLKTGGIFAGAIPAEGGIGWGLGRFFTTRRWFLRNTSINPDKIICWEHPNFADFIISQMNHFFFREKVKFWPAKIPILDVNLVISFIYRKKN